MVMVLGYVDVICVPFITCLPKYSLVYRTVEMYAHVKETLIWPSKWWEGSFTVHLYSTRIVFKHGKGVIKTFHKTYTSWALRYLTTFDWQPRVWADLAYFESL